jgi:alkaline phosphatase
LILTLGINVKKRVGLLQKNASFRNETRFTMLRNPIFFIFLSPFFYFSLFAQGMKIHSHNDYLQTQPFSAAFRSGCQSIEVDVFEVNGHLMVAHQMNEIVPGKTLASLYLKPLATEVKNQKGKVLALQLLIDIKTDPRRSLAAVVKELEKFPTLLSTDTVSHKIRFVISGKRPPIDEYKRYPSFIWFDFQELEAIEQADLSKVALISSSFSSFSTWKGEGDLPRKDEIKMIDFIKKAHINHKPARAWATPDTETAWKKLSALGFDFINTDQPEACARYFENTPTKR